MDPACGTPAGQEKKRVTDFVDMNWLYHICGAHHRQNWQPRQSEHQAKQTRRRPTIDEADPDRDGTSPMQTFFNPVLDPTI
jgi:hypothetical protein